MSAPSAVGKLADTPLAHGLVYARNRRLSGRLELTATDDRRAVISLWCGRITAVETTPLGMCPGGFFGAVVYELGFIDSATLDATLLEIAKSKRLHGEVLIERKAITAAQRDEALVEQVHRKVHHLFSLPETTSYAFYDAKMAVTEPPIAVDPVGPVWRGVRDYPPTKFVQETVRRVNDHALRVTAGGSARLPPAETALAEALAARPMTLSEMKAATDLPPSRVELLVYLLVIAKCVESVSGARTHPSTGALPTSMPSGPIPRVSVEPRRASGASFRATPPSGGVPAHSQPPSSRSIPVAAGSASRIPAAPGSSRIPAAPGSSSRIPAAPGSAPRISSTKIPAVGSPRPPPAGTLAALRSPAELGVEGIVARAATVTDEDYFQVLGVADGASAEAVRAAYVRLAKTWHPDRLHVDFIPIRGDVATVFAHMTRAHQTLCDADARRAYEASRKAKSTARPRAEVLREIEHAMGRRDFDTVVQLCEELLVADDEDVEAMAIQAWAGTRAGEASEDELRAALSKLDKAVNRDRTNDQAVYHRGLVHKRLGNVAAAFRDFARAVQLNPKHLEAEREVRIFAMRARKGSGEHKLVAPLVEKMSKK
ncbi:MAG: DnaJ domain-containing protein [Labilithrix sp.]|nr:DnaJ domain-containing protein [Labilithrix sp.]